MKVGFISLGCSKNLVDSEHIIAMFDNPAFEMESNPAKCDVIVINTCGFILLIPFWKWLNSRGLVS